MAFSTFLKDMIGIGLLQPDEDLEDAVRRAGGLPERKEGAAVPQPKDRVQTKEQTKDQAKDQTEPDTRERGRTGGALDEAAESRRSAQLARRDPAGTWRRALWGRVREDTGRLLSGRTVI